MTENKRFVNKGKDIFQYGEWWCSANGEHCANVIATAINQLIEENEKLKSKNRGLQSELQIFKEDATHSNLQINKLADENEQLKQDLSEYCNFSLHDVLDKKNKEIEQLKADKQALIDFIRKEFPKSHKHILEGFE